MSAKGWVGVDFDGTLAHYAGWLGEGVLGQPVLPMLERVKRMIFKDGMEVRIFTARANSPIDVKAIRQWCLDHIGVELLVTATKDYQMVCLYDDRCVQVISNTGILVERESEELT